MLQVDGLVVQYGNVVAVRGLTFDLPAGDAVAILGTNGAGKTSAVESIVGLLPKTAGVVRFEGQDFSEKSASTIARRGIALVPQLRELFFDFTVEETLLAARAACVGRTPVGMDEIFSLFPNLAQRRRSDAGNLSGGEQQMLAIGRALVTRPKLLILDELSAGLAQGVVVSVIASLKKIRASGLSLIVVEQNLEIAAALAERCVVMSVGEAVWRGSVNEAIGSASIRDAFFR
jgi:branched-chain amino acid transport system ATP-binding protein